LIPTFRKCFAKIIICFQKPTRHDFVFIVILHYLTIDKRQNFTARYRLTPKNPNS